MTSFGYHDPEGEGDILLLHTDGLTEHHQRGESYFPGRLEQKLRDVKFLPAAGIYEAIIADLLAFGPSDDISLVVVKRDASPSKSC